MSDASVLTLLLTAISLGTLHTVIGPDHYVPFIALARARRWSLRRTLGLTALCGVGHVLSSVVIGLVGVAAGVALTKVEGLESTRGSIATWALIAFGLVYGAWGLRRALTRRPHVHAHAHADGAVHAHTHDHGAEHAHPHGAGTTAWVLFIVFVFGPCEPLIPVLMYPAAQHDYAALALVTAAFSVATIGMMAVMTTLGFVGLRALRFGMLERYTHALAGGVLALSGAIVMLLGV